MGCVWCPTIPAVFHPFPALPEVSWSRGHFCFHTRQREPEFHKNEIKNIPRGRGARKKSVKWWPERDGICGARWDAQFSQEEENGRMEQPRHKSHEALSHKTSKNQFAFLSK